MYNVLIRPLHTEDAKISYQWRNDPEVWKFTGSRPNIKVTPEIETDWIKKVIAEPSSRRFAILCDGKYIGNVQLTDITDIDAEFHIFIGDKKYWNKGIASLATYEILYFAKTTLNLENINLSVKSDNVSAISSYKKNNFVLAENQDKEGLLIMSCNLKKLRPPQVSIFMMVYNHASYLEECLEGILMQKCNFNYEIVVGEDFSTDKSREILINYSNNFPGKFKLLLHEQNIGAQKNQEIVFNNCFGKYMAVCEGDDYWTDPLKLQKQVDFMEKNSDYSICFHKSQKIDGNNNILDNADVISENEEKTFTIEDLSMQNFMHTASVLFKKNFATLPEWVVHSPAGDYPLHMINARFGLIKYLPETMSVYRVGEGVWSSLSRVNQLVQTLMTVQLIINEFKDDVKVKSLLTAHYNSLLITLENFITEKNKVEINKEKIASTLRIRDLLKIIWQKLI